MRMLIAGLFALSLLTAGNASALEAMTLGGPKAPRPPTAAERAERVKAERDRIVERQAELVIRENALKEREATLRKQAAADAERERLNCPALIRVKYPWASCETNATGGKTVRFGEPNADELVRDFGEDQG